MAIKVRFVVLEGSETANGRYRTVLKSRSTSEDGDSQALNSGVKMIIDSDPAGLQLIRGQIAEATFDGVVGALEAGDGDGNP